MLVLSVVMKSISFVKKKENHIMECVNTAGIKRSFNPHTSKKDRLNIG